ncbi:MAG: hypothetical protein ABFR05_00225 [Bacteroidota bacterium]
MSPKEKIRLYIETKGITLYQFEKMIGISHGTMRKGKDFGVSILPKIREYFPDLNIGWLVYDEGEMILDREGVVTNKYDLGQHDKENLISEELIKLQKELINVQQDLIKCQKENASMKK